MAFSHLENRDCEITSLYQIFFVGFLFYNTCTFDMKSIFCSWVTLSFDLVTIKSVYFRAFLSVMLTMILAILNSTMLRNFKFFYWLHYTKTWTRLFHSSKLSSFFRDTFYFTYLFFVFFFFRCRNLRFLNKTTQAKIFKKKPSNLKRIGGYIPIHWLMTFLG